MSFLTAQWRKLILFNYAVDRQFLESYVPAGTELDLWENTCYLSLVGFMFLDTKVVGIKVPGHVNFEEVNLRFYVKRTEKGELKRGVVFIKEIVPKRAITFVANTLYKEHYQTMPMRHSWIEGKDTLEIGYEIYAGKRWHSMWVSAAASSGVIDQGTETEFITEHYWGYSRTGTSKSIEYEVRHPRWKSYKVLNHKLDLDFSVVYGNEFDFLNNLKPESVMLAEGSEIAVEYGTAISS